MIDIFSIHIPKTAGRSFYQVLRWAYGEKVDIPRNMDKYVHDEKLDETCFNKSISVIHGHFYFNHIRYLFEKHNARIIAWLRDPVDRVISNYYYNMYVNKTISSKRNAAKRVNLDLLEFASRDKRRNVMSNYLCGIEPEKIFFRGFTESFEEDIQELGKRLDWQLPVPNFRINDGSGFIDDNDCFTQYSSIDENMREKIGQLNNKDVELYEKCKLLNAK